MRQDLERLLRDTTLVTLACAIALGWSLFQVAEGLGYFVVTTFQTAENSPGGLSFTVGQHVFYFDPLVQGLIEFAVVLAVVLFARRRSRPSSRQPS